MGVGGEDEEGNWIFYFSMRHIKLTIQILHNIGYGWNKHGRDILCNKASESFFEQN